MDDYGNHCPKPEDGAGYITISFNLVTSNTMQSRADSEEDSGWCMLEDYIDTKDFVFFIYAVLDEATHPLIKVVDMSTAMNEENEDPHTNISGGPYTYTVRVAIPKSAIDNIIPNGNDDINFRIVAFANTNGRYKSLTSSTTSSLNGLISEAESWYYNVLETLYSGVNDYVGYLDLNAKIPMYGTKSFKVTRTQLSTSRPDSPVFIGNMSMLRSLAKIKVIDVISNEDALTGLPRVESVTFDNVTNSAFVLPYDVTEYKNEDQVQHANPCGTTPMKINLLKNGDKTWIGYVPEQLIQTDKSPVPSFKLTLTYEVDAVGNPILSNQKTFIVPMTGYNDQVFSFGEAILRNHIYTLEVDIETSQLNLNVAVNDWRTLTYEYEY